MLQGFAEVATESTTLSLLSTPFALDPVLNIEHTMGEKKGMVPETSFQGVRQQCSIFHHGTKHYTRFPVGTMPYLTVQQGSRQPLHGLNPPVGQPTHVLSLR